MLSFLKNSTQHWLFWPFILLLALFTGYVLILGENGYLNYRSALAEKTRLEQKIQAFEDAERLFKQSKGAITSHLIGRMLSILEDNQEVVKNFLKNIQAKKAGKILEKYDLFGELNPQNSKFKSYDDYQVYWKTFFEVLRKKNKNA